MIALGILWAFCAVFHLGDAIELRTFRFQGLQEPDTSGVTGVQNIQESWIEQPLDQFNPRDNRTWLMRYMQNSALYKPGGPIFIMIGGEWEISEGYLMTGLMYDIAQTHNGMLYYTEHRYYGKSHPTKDLGLDNLQYLNADQSLADLAYFIDTKKKEKSFQNSKVFVFGGSYAGNLAAWARLKYPHLIQGALASSAPVFAKADFAEYYGVVTESLRSYSQLCVDDIKAAFHAIETMVNTTRGREKLKTYFNLCNTLQADAASDRALFFNTLAEAFAGVVQYEIVSKGQSKIATTCNHMTASYLGTPLQRLARLVTNQNRCLNLSYVDFIKSHVKTDWNKQPDIMRQWYYQTCTEYGYFQTSTSQNSIFSTMVPLSFFTQICQDLYSRQFNGEYLDVRVKRTNIMNGGLRPDLRNVIFTNGDVDPWHPLSVLKDLNAQSPAILIKGSSHCRDLAAHDDADVPDLIRARVRVRQIMNGWILS